METVGQIADDDQQSWFAAWSATSDRVFKPAELTKDPIGKGNAYLCAHGYQRTGSFLLPLKSDRQDLTADEIWRT
jgi:hypothetical protein